MNKKLCRTLAGLAVSAALSGSAEAASVSYLLNQSNALPDGIDYLRVTIDDEGALGNINFTVTPLSALTSTAGSNFGIQKFGFNETGLTSANILLTGGATTWSKSPSGGNVSEFGNFTYLLSGTGSHRTNPLTFSVTGVSGDTIASYANSSTTGAPFFVAHVAGFSIGCTDSEDDSEDTGSNVSLSSKSKSSSSEDDDEDECSATTSAYFAGRSEILVPPNSVPLPASLWLMMSGLIGMVGVSRSKQSK